MKLLDYKLTKSKPRRKISGQNYYSRQHDYATATKDSISFESLGMLLTSWISLVLCIKEIHLDHNAYNTAKSCKLDSKPKL